jgi:SAM-dependent methyltransferase
MNLKNILIKSYWFFSAQLGIDPLRFIRSIRSLPLYICDWLKFITIYKGKVKILPCLHDRYEEGGSTKNEYFWQDLLVARWIYEAKPQKHVDIGSRVDGFVAHVASFREIEIFDVRYIISTIPGVVFRQADVMDFKSLSDSVGEEYCDSLSCLHALEHFGLGRYGDPINPLGFRHGLENMIRILKPGGLFYLSTPIGIERVEFNANWVFDPRTILQIAKTNKLELKSLFVFNHKDGVTELEPSDKSYESLSFQNYNLGIFTFRKSQERIRK